MTHVFLVGREPWLKTDPRLVRFVRKLCQLHLERRRRETEEYVREIMEVVRLDEGPVLKTGSG